jgi:hypothetical protein
MGWSELAGRGRQELRKRFDRRFGAGRYAAGDLFDSLEATPELSFTRARAEAGDRAGAADALFERFLDGGPGRFFEGAVSAAVPALLGQRMPDAAAAVRMDAEAIMRGRFDLLGYRDLSFGSPPDWHLDPVSGRRAPLTHWSRIDALDAERVGDSKVIWELNRHQWLVRLGQAYRLNREERYARRFAETIRDWKRANPTGLGINWASSLEIALRLIAWCWAAMLFRGARALDADLFAEILAGVADHAAHVERYLSHYFSPNTHLTGEALGLVYAGFVFPELSRARRWRHLGERILIEEFRRQVLSDGLHFERSTCYHRYTLEIYLHFLLLSQRNGAVCPPSMRDGIEAMVDALLDLRQPDGTMPPLGDADGGWLLPLAPRAPDDARGVFAVAAAVFRRPEHAWAAGGPAPETLWLGGPTALAEMDRIAGRAPEAATAVLPDAGYAVMRSGREPHAHQLILDAGPLGCPVSGGHGHADLLAIQCAIFGEPVIVDPGTYGYADVEWRNFFRGSGAHSTITVDGLDQATPRGPFSWHVRPSARLLKCVSTETLDIADAEHAAYAELADPVIHRRRVFWAKPHYWVLVDDLTGAAEHRIELRFQFAPMDVAVDGALWARAVSARGAALFVRAFATAPLSAEVATGSLAPRAGWVSPAYGCRQPAPVLIYRTAGRLPMRVATLLMPAASASAPPPTVAPLGGGAAVLTGLDFDDGRETLRFDDAEALRRLSPRASASAASPGTED